MDVREWQARNDRRRLNGEPEHPYCGSDAPWPDETDGAADADSTPKEAPQRRRTSPKAGE